MDQGLVVGRGTVPTSSRSVSGWGLVVSKVLPCMVVDVCLSIRDCFFPQEHPQGDPDNRPQQAGSAEQGYEVEPDESMPFI